MLPPRLLSSLEGKVPVVLHSSPQGRHRLDQSRAPTSVPQPAGGFSCLPPSACATGQHPEILLSPPAPLKSIGRCRTTSPSLPNEEDQQTRGARASQSHPESEQLHWESSPLGLVPCVVSLTCPGLSQEACVCPCTMTGRGHLALPPSDHPPHSVPRMLGGREDTGNFSHPSGGCSWGPEGAETPPLWP